MTTIHAFTSDQRILDNSHKDPEEQDLRSIDGSYLNWSLKSNRRNNTKPKRKLEGISIKYPPNVSLVELVFCTKKTNRCKKISDAFEQASKTNLKNILEVTHEKLVSIDFNHHSASAIVDTSLTNVVGGNMGKISAWYDNEWGFSNRMCDILKLCKIS